MHITKRKKPAKDCDPAGEVQGPSSSKDMGSKRFTVLIVSDPFRTKTSWRWSRRQQSVFQEEKQRTMYGFAVDPVVSASTSSFDTTLTSESLYLNHESGCSGKCLE